VTEVRFAMKPGKIGERSGELVDLHVRVDLVSSIDEGYDDGGGEGGGTRGDGNVGREQGHLV
jgi:hypothetical protein